MPEDNQFVRKKELFFLTMSEVSVRAHLVLRLRPMAAQCIMEWRIWGCKVAHLIEAGKQEVRDLGLQHPLLGHSPSYLISFHEDPHPKGSATLNSTTD
jgi:hypothetical protein